MGRCALEELYKATHNLAPMLRLKPRHVLQYELLQAIASNAGDGIVLLAYTQSQEV